MGWLDKLFGAKPRSEWARGWSRTSIEAQAATTRAFLEAVSGDVGGGEAKIAVRSKDRVAELRGQVGGFPFRLQVGLSGSVEDLALKQEGDLEPIDIDYDPELEGGSPPDELEPWEAEERYVLGPGVFISGASRHVEADAFHELPVKLQERVVGELRRLRVRTFRSRPHEHLVTVWDEAREVAEPVRWLADILRLTADVSRARGARPPDQVPEPSPSPPADAHAGATPEQWARGQAMARRVAGAVLGGHVVEQPDGRSIEVHWSEDDVPVWVLIEAYWDQFEAIASAQGVEAEFWVYWDDEVEVEPAPAADDETPPDEVERKLFLGRNTYLEGTMEELAAQAAVFRALPEALLAELLSVTEAAKNGPDLQDGELEILVDTLGDVADDATQAVSLARFLARVVQALPKGPPPAPLAETPATCGTCGALWLPGPSRQPCANCGAPA